MRATDRRKGTSRTAAEDEDRLFGMRVSKGSVTAVVCYCHGCYNICLFVQDGPGGACCNGSTRCRSVTALQPNAIRGGSRRQEVHGGLFNGTERAKCEYTVVVGSLLMWPPMAG